MCADGAFSMGIRSTGVGALLVVAAVSVMVEPAVAAKKHNAAHAAKAAKAAEAARDRAKERALEKDADAARKAEATANKDKADAQQRLAEANKQLKASVTGIDALEEKVKKAVQRLKDLEKKIEDAEPADSKFVKARTALEEAEKAYRQAQDRVLKSPEYVAKYTALVQSEAESPAVLRKQALDNDEGVTKAKGNLDAAKGPYSKAREELLEKHPEWSEASQAVRDAKKQLADAVNKVGGQVLHKRTASRDLKDAAAAAAAAQAAEKQDEAKLKKLNAEKHKKGARH